MITTRDYAQVRQLAEMFKLDYTEIGRHYGKNLLSKAYGMVFRAIQLLPTLLRERPALSLSHGSRSQQLISKLFGVPTALCADYLHTSSGFPFDMPDLLLVPKVVYDSLDVASFKKVLPYRGIKEDVYIPKLDVDNSILTHLNLDPQKVIVTLRPPATKAHYYVPKSGELYEKVLERIVKTPGVQAVILPRTEDQGAEIKEKWKDALELGKLIIPKQAVNGLTLIWNSDLVISGGGTIIREAAALGVPAYSIFAGAKGAVDAYLEESGKLVFIDSFEEVQNSLRLEKRPAADAEAIENTPALEDIINEVVAFVGEHIRTSK